jgi:hypothetical protein
MTMVQLKKNTEMQRLGELADPNSPEIRQKKLPESDS